MHYYVVVEVGTIDLIKMLLMTKYIENDMRNIKMILILVVCIIILSGIVYTMRGWNKTRIERDKFKKATFAAYCDLKVTNPKLKIYFNEDDGGIEHIYMIDSIGKVQGEWRRATNIFSSNGYLLEPSAELVGYMAVEYMLQQPKGTSFDINELTSLGVKNVKQFLKELYCNYLYIYPQNEQSVLKAIELSSDNRVKSIIFYNNFGIVLSANFNPWGNYYNVPELVRVYMKELDCSYEEASQLLLSHCQKACMELQEGVLIMGKSPLLIK